MAIDSDESIALPSPPPPRPAARKAAIETALRRFDGIEEPTAERPARERPSRPWWATMHRRPAGALMATALIAIIGIPAMQIALREPAEVATEGSDANLAPPVRNVTDEVGPPSEAPREPATDAAAFAPSPSPTQSVAPPSIVSEDRPALTSAESDRKAAREAPAPMTAAPAPVISAAPPAPPPPPPPPPPPEPEAAAEDGNIVVTGSRVRRPNVGKQRGAADQIQESASSFAMIDPHDAFLSRLQAGLRSNDRRAIVRLIGFPLRVNFDGEPRTYRTARDVNRDFDRIFTADVRQSALTLRPDALMSRDGGKLKGSARLWFGCGESSCSPGETIRIKEVNP